MIANGKKLPITPSGVHLVTFQRIKYENSEYICVYFPEKPNVLFLKY